MNEIYLIEKDNEGKPIVGRKLNFVGGGVGESIDYEELKKYIEENYLKLTGGTLTGPINLTLNTDASDPNATAAHQDIAFVGNSGETKFGLIRCDQAKNRRYIHLSPVDETNTPHTGIQVNWDYTINKDYCLCNDPRGLYNKDIVNYQSMVDYAPHKLTTGTTFHVNANTGSDTADLFSGRGLSEDKPFKTLDACLCYVLSNFICSAGVTSIMLHSDVICDNSPYYALNHAIKITSDDIQRKITLTNANGFKINGGAFWIDNVIIDAPASNNVNYCIWVTGAYNAHLLGCYLSNVQFTGIVNTAVVRVINGGAIFLDGTISGNITGRRYYMNRSSRIDTNGKGVNAIPGTIAGTCDSSSTYA